VKGLLLSGVIAGVRLASGASEGRRHRRDRRATIANIYDYTYALDLLKIGQTGQARLPARWRAS